MTDSQLLSYNWRISDVRSFIDILHLWIETLHMKTLVNVQKLKWLREANGWSQAQLSAMSRTSLRTIQRMERDGGCSVESLKSAAAVFDLDFKELLREDEIATELKTIRYPFWVEFRKIWFRNRIIFWAMNLSIAFLSGLLFSVFLSGDREKLILITTGIITEVILCAIVGGYPTARKKFIRKYGNILEEGG